MAAPPFQVKAIYEYSSPHDDDLSFPIGQNITVTEEEGDDWYYGAYTEQNGNKKEGLFPRNFVKTYEPETPPRPSRLSRPKKDLESSKAASEDAPTAQLGTSAPSLEEESTRVDEPVQSSRAAAEEPTKFVDPPLAATQGSTAVTAAKPPLPASSKPAPPSASESTAKSFSGSFKDRINAFNKPAAPPVAPTKPGGLGSSSGSGFVKKAFVAPPPSKNAYVPVPREAPPQKIYRREEEPEAETQAQLAGEAEPSIPPGIQQPPDVTGEAGNQPKPTSLKERIALLQQQQMEQAARHADAAQKKEKPKRPAKKRMESQERVAENEDDHGAESFGRVDSGDTASKRSVDMPRVSTDSRARPTQRSLDSPETTPIVSPSGPPRQFLSDANDADMSGAADTEEGEDTSTSREELDGSYQRPPQQSSYQSPRIPSEEPERTNEEEGSEEEEEEEEEVDPEVKKRMEIRERMAKMSGGMGMAGMFGPPGGIAPMPSRKQAQPARERKPSGERKATGDSTSSRAPPVPMMPMPGLTKVQSPDYDSVSQTQVSREDEADIPMSVTQGRAPADMPDVEDLKEEPVVPSRRSTDRSQPPSAPHERPVPPPPTQARAAPPPPPRERPVPLPPSEPKTQQPAPSGQILSQSEGSESDDEMSADTRKMSLRVPTSDDSRPDSRDGPPPVPGAHPGAPPPTLPSRPRQPAVQIPPAAVTTESNSTEASPKSPVTPSIAAKRSSRPPPIPGSNTAVPVSTSQARAPPPPPPASGPPTRSATGDVRVPPPVPKAPAMQDSDEEVTEYEGDYDTDIASGASHKQALKSHSRETPKDPSVGDDAPYPEMYDAPPTSHGPKPPGPSRAVPPPPPNQPPRGPRQSFDMPRGVPPPPPPPKEPSADDSDGEYNTYDRSTSNQYAHPALNRAIPEPSAPSQPTDPDDQYFASQSQRSIPPSPAMSSSQYASPPLSSAPGRAAPRQSLDVQRTSTSGRRSMEVPRVSSDQGFIASDLDLGHGTQWWTQPNTPPPTLQNRRDVIYEIEDSTTNRRGGRQAVTRSIYVLYMDYSQTIIAAHFETRDPSDASLEQHHEPPPPRLRQDQLENAHIRFGARIAEAANSKKETVVGDGTPNALTLDLINSLPEALRPVGVRAYGALVYANLANASVQQFDEIRSGDIVTFRNARFQGHRGAMHAKYAVDVGKPDHVAVVVDWDGTKKKVRAWEQGRESKKVKMESFKLGDMRSGEVKVWRVMARQWVGWE
ncbi:MAG: hypothetical protein LQ346_000655 [Caloplaca aetnensis]|nr:MAG: hypothetical protein LQ346_000655 [Caloplaca aetnensis]